MNMHNLFYGKCKTKYCFQDFSSKTQFRLNESRKLDFGSTFSHISVVLLGRLFPNTMGFTHRWSNINHVNFMSIGLKLQPVSCLLLYITQRLSQNTIYTRYTIYQSSQVAGCVEHFETSRKSVRTPLYNNFRVRYSTFSKSSYSDPSQIKITETNFIHRHLLIHNQFSWFALLQNTDSHSQCRVPFFQPILL